MTNNTFQETMCK